METEDFILFQAFDGCLDKKADSMDAEGCKQISDVLFQKKGRVKGFAQRCMRRFCAKGAKK